MLSCQIQVNIIRGLAKMGVGEQAGQSVLSAALGAHQRTFCPKIMQNS